MHAIGKKTQASSPTSAQPGNRVAARSRLKPRSTYPTASVVPLKPGPLTRLAWLFLGSNR